MYVYPHAYPLLHMLQIVNEKKKVSFSIAVTFHKINPFRFRMGVTIF